MTDEPLEDASPYYEEEWFSVERREPDGKIVFLKDYLTRYPDIAASDAKRFNEVAISNKKFTKVDTRNHYRPIAVMIRWPKESK